MYCTSRNELKETNTTKWHSY